LVCCDDSMGGQARFCWGLRSSASHLMRGTIITRGPLSF
jgi:hypothetical protein